MINRLVQRLGDLRAWFWVGTVLTAIMGGLVAVSLPPDLPGTFKIESAVASLQSPTPAAPKEVRLPHVWDDERPRWEGTGRYDIAWPANAKADDKQPLSLYLPRVGSRFRVLLNGHVIEERGWNEPGYVDTSAVPYMIDLPAALLLPNAADNNLVIEVQGKLLRRSGLAPMLMGPHDVIESRYAKIFWWQVHATWMVAACSVLLAVLSILMWMQSRERVFAMLACASVAWAIRLGLTPAVNPHMPFELWFYLHKLSFTVYCGFLYLFLWELFDFRQGFARRLVLGLLWVGPVWLAVTTLSGNYNLYRIWTGILACVSIVTMVLMFRRARWGLDVNQRLMVVVGVVTLVTGVRDFLVVQLGFPGDGDLRWMTTGSLVFMMTLAWVVVQRTSSYMQQVGQLNRELVQRVQDRESELRHAFEQLRDAERRQVLEEERQRLTRDMHDGLGSQLVQTLNLVRGSERVDPATVAAMLTHALEELRTTLDSMEPLDGDLPAILGTLRRRIGPPLEAAGIELIWEVQELSPIAVHGQPMDSRGVMHLFRCLQEVFANIVKHADATQVAVRTWMDGKHAWLSVSDNGRGIGEGSREGGRGLGHIRLRASELGADVSFSAAEPGTRVEFRFATVS